MKAEVTHENNVYAADITNVVRHISEVESGRKGYYCLGCGREMQAKKGDIRVQHFAHDPKDVLNKGKCAYSDESYRHKLAKEILQRIKQIKVPPVYKYPPQGIEGKPYKLKGSEFITAESVKIELTFFENSDGTIIYDRDVNFDTASDKFLLIRPDVTFFDQNENPILLIEIVATHKISAEKLSKIKKLGIDTIQVSIPKDSPEEIEDTFFKTTRTQWIYNYEQEQTTYIPNAQGDSEGIPPLDEFQRKLLEAAESYECRASQINNLIRGINKCLGSQSYTDSEQNLRAEIQRVEGNTESNRQRLRGIEEQYKAGIEKEFAMEKGTIEEQERAITEKSRLLDEDRAGLESRYYRKREELDRTHKDYRSEVEDEVERITRAVEQFGTNESNFGERIIAIEREEAAFERFVSDEINRIEEATRAISEAIAELDASRATLPEKYAGIEAALRAEFEQKGELLELSFEQQASGIREQFERDGRASTLAIEARDSGGVSRVQRRLRSILETRDKLSDLRKSRFDLLRIRQYKVIFDQGTFKDKNGLL